MYAVGRLGSYITRGVYTVSGPFHPFGGAVDMVVVQQQDGSLKSSPWYVRFGKFQGVLKGKEKVIDINVNGVDASFHMYLDQRGEAYFLQEIVPEDGVDAASPPSSSGEEMDGRCPDRTRVKSKSLDCNYDDDESVDNFGDSRLLTRNNGKVLSRSNSKRSRILGFVLGRNSMKEGGSQNVVDDSECNRTRSLERAEMAADLLETKWSTNLSSQKSSKNLAENDTEGNKDVGEVNGGRLESGMVLHEEHFGNNMGNPEVDNEMNSKIASDVDGVVVANFVHEDRGCSLENYSNEPEMGVVTAENPVTIVSETGVASNEESLRNGLDGSHGAEMGVITAEEPSTVVSETGVVSSEESLRNYLGGSNEPEMEVVTVGKPLSILSESCTEAATIPQGDASAEMESQSCMEAASIQLGDASAEVESETCAEAASPRPGKASAELEPESRTEAASTLQGNDWTEVKSVRLTEAASPQRRASAELESESFTEAAPPQGNPSTEVESESSTEAASIPQGDASAEVESESFTAAASPQGNAAEVESESFTEAASIPQGNASAEVESENSIEAASIRQGNALAEVESESSVEAASIQQGNDSAEVESEFSIEAPSIQQADASAKVESESFKGGVSIQLANALAEVESESYTEAASIQQENDSVETESCSVPVSDCKADDAKSTEEVDETNEVRPPLEPNSELQDGFSDSMFTRDTRERSVEEQFAFSDLDDFNPNINHMDQENQSMCTSKVNLESSEPMSPNSVSNSYPPRFDSLADDMEGLKRKAPSNVDIPGSYNDTEEEVGRLAKSLPNMWSQFDEFDPTNRDGSVFYSFGSRTRNSKWDLLRKDASRIIRAARENELPLSSLQDADSVSEDAKDASNAGSDSGNIINSTSGSWSLWPFRRSKSQKFTTKEQNSKKDSDADSRSETNGEQEISSPKCSKTRKRTLTPTSEQLASLNLNEGKNTVTFTFSTSVLGEQQVDARIFLWRWDARIVISDVDGTITKSDVLGQFMPLVGRDWSHIGVTHLFSAIKENGYQMLFLSARAISQAYITRQFLFNLNQDGKTLPEGPVVISPDGLFPSLFREVIRRCPHEFKIACLEDIKACFPPDRNPFYAGFGNRDTDEFSYLKVGIAKGKIFIINPKGEVVVNRCVDSKSYTTLHAMVNDIFPPISVHEEPVFS